LTRTRTGCGTSADVAVPQPSQPGHGQPAAAAKARRRRSARTRQGHPADPCNLPLHGYDQNQIWCEIVALACELLAWTAMLAQPGAARRREPKKMRLRLFSVAGRIVRGSRRLWLRLSARWPRAGDITAAIRSLQALAPG